MGSGEGGRWKRGGERRWRVMGGGNAKSVKACIWYLGEAIMSCHTRHEVLICLRSTAEAEKRVVADPPPRVRL